MKKEELEIRLRQAEETIASNARFEEATEITDRVLIEQCAAVGSRVNTLAKAGKIDEIWNAMTALTLPKGYTLGIDEARRGRMNVSVLWASNKDGVNDNDIFKYINVEESPMGAWQVFLLRDLWHSLKLIDHYCCARRYYLFSSQDFGNVNPFRKEDKVYVDALIGREDFTPHIYRNGEYFYVDYYYWNDWNGLVRECMEICISDNKATSIFDLFSILVVKYDCQIMF